MTDKKRVDFYKKCSDLKKQVTRREASIYSEYSQIKFAEYWKTYQKSYRDAKEKSGNDSVDQQNAELLEHHRAELIAFGSLSMIDQFEKACSCANRKKQFEELSNYSRQLAQEKSTKKIQISNIVSFIKRVAPILKARNI